MIGDERELETALSEPSQPLVEAMAEVDGDLMILGAGGKMGPTLARMARRASDAAGIDRRVFAVSRFTDISLRERLQSWNIDTLVGDLFDPRFLTSLPDVRNVIYFVGVKFGTGSAQGRTWASNTYLPGAACQRFPDSRFVALSTGNVYGMVPAESGGSIESDALRPDGEYAMSAVGRERVFDYFSREHDIPMALIRLNYATELRYGVLVDLAQTVLRGDPVSLSMGYANVIWQADANDMILRSLLHASSPPMVLNVTGPEKLSCRNVCQQLGVLMQRDVTFRGSEAPNAFLNDASRAHDIFGLPRMPATELLELTADWLMRGQPTWNKPTHFEVRDGKY